MYRGRWEESFFVVLGWVGENSTGLRMGGGILGF